MSSRYWGVIEDVLRSDSGVRLCMRRAEVIAERIVRPLILVGSSLPAVARG
jgi:hypothetical protein